MPTPRLTAPPGSRLPEVRVGPALRFLGAWLLMGLLGPNLAAQDAPWFERAGLPPFIGTTTAERLAAATVLIVADFDVLPGDLLDVDPWTTLNGSNDPGADSRPICSTSELFYGQPTPGAHPPGITIRGCSGFLVGPDLVLTAGHCISPPPGQNQWLTPSYACGNRYAIFDFANLDPVLPGEEVPLNPDQAVQCDEVLVDTALGPERPLPKTAAGGGDWALLRLSSPVTDRLPLVIERFPQTQAGDDALVLGHPARIPLKAEFAEIESSAGNVTVHALSGNSGSAMLNVGTGKVYGVLTSARILVRDGGWVIEKTNPTCVDLCFECPGGNASGTSSSFWVGSVPPIGLLIEPPPGNVVDYYGPPTNVADYEPWTTTLQVAEGSLPEEIPLLSWSVHQDDDGPQFFERVDGPPYGTLADGEATTVTILPTNVYLSEPGLLEMTYPFFDETYGTRDPILHRAHVGVDGFTVFPDDPFDGDFDLGVAHGAAREYTPVNRWIVTQDLTIQTSDPWIELNGEDGTNPISITLPPAGYIPEPVPIVSLNGSGLLPGTRAGTVTFSSDHCDLPGCEIVGTVYFDHRREKFTDMTLPFEIEDLGVGQDHEQVLMVTPTGGSNIIDDVDVVVELTPPGPVPAEKPYQVFLESPQGVVVLLKDSGDPPQVVYDDETLRPASGFLEDFEGAISSGEWTLRVRNTGTGALSLTLGHFEVRLHHSAAGACEP